MNFLLFSPTTTNILQQPNPQAVRNDVIEPKAKLIDIFWWRHQNFASVVKKLALVANTLNHNQTDKDKKT